MIVLVKSSSESVSEEEAKRHVKIKSDKSSEKEYKRGVNKKAVSSSSESEPRHFSNKRTQNVKKKSKKDRDIESSEESE